MIPNIHVVPDSDWSHSNEDIDNGIPNVLQCEINIRGSLHSIKTYKLTFLQFCEKYSYATG